MIKVELSLDFFPYFDDDGNIVIDVFRGEEDEPCQKVIVRIEDVVKSELEMFEVPGTNHYSEEGCELMAVTGKRLAHQARRLINASKRVYVRKD